MNETTIPWQQLGVDGEARRRALLNFDRLETEPYRPDTVFRPAEYDWPGDWEGRTILALVLLAQSTRREPKHLNEIMERLPAYLNEQGFFGPCHAAGTVDEQQLSGNSWFLRAMVEHYKWKKDAFSLSVIERIIDHLLLPACGHYANYPVLPEQRVFAGEAMGSLQQEQIGAWRLSTDIGCAFIMLDGATHAYQIVQRPELGELIEEMIAKFKTIDLAGLSFQTHATLSALRGVLRHYETTGEESLLDKAEEVFALYTQAGMTATYANYNWFGRPDWTESCAVVDSFIVAVSLWEHTGKPAYLDTAHHIYYNGLGYGQRPNGGFGCDVCSGAHGEMMIAPKSPELFEASWCCTMRGGEGLSRSIAYSYFTADRLLTIPFYTDSTCRVQLAGGLLALRQRTGYPYAGDVELEVTASTINVPITIRLYVPGWVDAPSVQVLVDGLQIEAAIDNGFAVIRLQEPPVQGMKLAMSFPIQLRVEPAEAIEGRKLYSYRHGALLLGVDCESMPAQELQQNEEQAMITLGGSGQGLGLGLASKESFKIEPLGGGSYRIIDSVTSSAVELTPINDLLDKPLPSAIHNRKQVLFYDE